MEKKVMIVEDEAVFAHLLEKGLSTGGYKVIGPISRGEEALKLFNDEHPDAVLMDINLPGTIDGIEAARMIKKINNTPIIFMTAYSNEEIIEQAKSLNPRDYFIKPVTINQVKLVLDCIFTSEGEES